MRNYVEADFQVKFKQLGYKWDTGIQLIGVRSNKPISNEFSDRIYCFKDTQLIVVGVATTIPGRPYLLKPMNPKGCAILKEGQYVHCWKLGLHNGYEALIQCAPITVYRDANRDAIVDKKPGTEDTGLFNVDIHHAGQSFVATFIDNFSAGCQVWDNINDFNKMLSACKASMQPYFTYTLLDEF